MNDDVENLILEQLRPRRADMAAMQDGLVELGRKVDEGFSGVNGRIDGLVPMVRLPATHVPHVGERVGRLESR